MSPMGDCRQSVDVPAVNAIEAWGLVKRYGSKLALDGVDLEVARGSVCGLLGPNGAGKTTAVRILTTLTTPDAGTARIAGHAHVRCQHVRPRHDAAVGAAPVRGMEPGHRTRRSAAPALRKPGATAAAQAPWSLVHPVLYTLLWGIGIVAICAPVAIRSYQASITR